MADHAGYNSSHPWYYKLGGRILSPAEIAAEVEHELGTTGDFTMVEKLDQMNEPRRSNKIRKAIEQLQQSQQQNVERYHEVTEQLTYERERPGPYEWDKRRMWSDPTTAVSLKHNHIAYAHATICRLNDLVSVQLELF